MKNAVLVEGPPIAGHHVQHCDEKHQLIIDTTIVPCTPSEYIVLMLVLQTARVVPLTTLAEKALQSKLTRSTRRALTQHVSRARAKLWPFGLDIRCIAGHGYLMVSLSPEQSAPQAG